MCRLAGAHLLCARLRGHLALRKSRVLLCHADRTGGLIWSAEGGVG